MDELGNLLGVIVSDHASGESFPQSLGEMVELVEFSAGDGAL